MDRIKGSIRLKAESSLPTEFGQFTVKVYESGNGDNAIAIISGATAGRSSVPVRVHSACYTAEVLGSLKCDCKQQLDIALQHIAAHDGVVIYLPQEGRGIGLSNKIRAYALQELGHDTITANTLLGLPVDSRSYEDAAAIIADLQIQSIRLLTNNPEKVAGLQALGINIRDRIPVKVQANKHSAAYLHTKRQSMGHWLEFEHQNTTQSLTTPRHEQPFVHINFAIDGTGNTVLSSNNMQTISCQKDWQRVHELREKYAAVAVGANTWLQDNPRLTARHKHLGRKPIRQPDQVIFAGGTHCPCNPDARRMFVIASPAASPVLHATNITITGHSLREPLQALARQQVDSLLVEGGLLLIRSFLQQNCAHLLTVYVSTECHSSALNAIASALPELAEKTFAVQSLGSGTLLSTRLLAKQPVPAEQFQHA